MENNKNTIEYEYIVYKTTNKINKKIYIGVHRTVKNSEDLFKGYGIKKRKRKAEQNFKSAVAKYGYASFKRETLFTYPDTEEGKKAAYKKEAELVNWDFIRRKDTYNTKIGGVCISSELLKPVAQYDHEGNFIQVWHSVIEVQEFGFASANSVSNCCIKETYTNQCQWRYFTGSTENIASVTPKIRAIYQFDLQGNYITYYKTIEEASNATQIDPILISNVCEGAQNQAGGYFWNYKKRFAYIPLKQKFAVACYNDDGTFIKSFDSIEDAEKAYKVQRNSIIACIHGKCKHCKKVRWRYFYGNTSPISPL